MRKIALPLLFLALSTPLFAQTCESSTNTDSNGNPCTNFVTKAGPVTNGQPSGYALYSQDGVLNTSTSSEGVFNLFSSTAVNTYLPVDPVVTPFGFNVVYPYESPYGSLQLNGGSVTSATAVNTTPILIQGESMTVPRGTGYTKSFAYALTGSPTSVDITLSGCYQGSCTVLNTYTATYSTSFNVYVGSAVYDSFVINVVTLSQGATVQLQAPCTHRGAYLYTESYVFVSGPETIDPPDANGNNTYTWAGTLSVPFTFDHCISGSGRGGGYQTSPTYSSGMGTGKLSATPSIQ